MKSMLQSLLRPTSCNLFPCFSDEEDEISAKNEQETPIPLDASSFETAWDGHILILNSPGESVGDNDRQDFDTQEAFTEFPSHSPSETNREPFVSNTNEGLFDVEGRAVVEPETTARTLGSIEYLQNKATEVSSREQVEECDPSPPFPSEGTSPLGWYFASEDEDGWSRISNAIQKSNRLYSHFICWWLLLENINGKNSGGSIALEILKRSAENYPRLLVQALRVSGCNVDEKFRTSMRKIFPCFIAA